MQLTPQEYVGRALALLEAALAPMQLQPARPISAGALDAQSLLGALLDHQESMFHNDIERRDALTYVHELKATRNKWAHSDPLTFSDAYRAADTVGRLLGMLRVASPDVDALKRELRAIEAQQGISADTPATMPKPGPSALSTIALIACGKQKQAKAAPAIELYTGPLVRRSVETARSEGLPIFILSTRYGLVGGTTVLEPYELSIEAMTPTERGRWQELLKSQFAPLCGSGLQRVVTFAGTAYLNAVQEALKGTAVIVESHAAWKAICRETFGS